MQIKKIDICWNAPNSPISAKIVSKLFTTPVTALIFYWIFRLNHSSNKITPNLATEIPNNHFSSIFFHFLHLKWTVPLNHQVAKWLIGRYFSRFQFFWNKILEIFRYISNAHRSNIKSQVHWWSFDSRMPQHFANHLNLYIMLIILLLTQTYVLFS